MAESLRTNIYEEFAAEKTEHAKLRTFIDHPRRTLDASGDLVHSTKGDFLRLDVDKNSYHRAQAIIQKDLRSIQEALNNSNQEMDPRFERTNGKWVQLETSPK